MRRLQDLLNTKGKHPHVTQCYVIHFEPLKHPLNPRMVGCNLLSSLWYAVNQFHYLSLQTPKNLPCTLLLHSKYITIVNKFIYQLYFWMLFFEHTLINEGVSLPLGYSKQYPGTLGYNALYGLKVRGKNQTALWWNKNVTIGMCSHISVVTECVQQNLTGTTYTKVISRNLIITIHEYRSMCLPQ